MRDKIALTVRLFALAAAFCIAGTAWGATETVGGYTWTYRINGDTAEIYGTYNGYPSYDYTPAISPSPTGTVTIPSTLGGKPVTSIGVYAFSDCSGLTSVIIGNSVKSIGDSAFYGCSGLTSVTIGNGVTSIGDWAFSDCSGLTSVTIPDGVTSIGDYAFYRCSGLTIVTIPDSVTSIGDGAFYGCSGLTSVTIPDLVTSIGEGAFGSCSGLMSVTIGNSVTSIGYGAFNNCRDLRNVTMKGDAPSVGNYAFVFVYSPCVVLLPRGNETYDVINGKWQGMTVEYYGLEFTIDANGALTGVNLNGATEIVIPDGVTSIGENVFKDCASLKSVIIPEGVNEIGYYAFRGCSSLETVSLPSTLTNIVTAAFEYCTSLRSIEIPASVTSIGTWLFNGCTSLVSVVMHEGIPSIPYKMFTGCSSLAEIDIPNGVADIGAEAFRDCRRLKKVTIPDSVASIGARTFWDCNNLASLSIPDSVTSIGYAAFAYCYDLADVTMGSGVISLGEYVFWSCSGLKSVTMKGDAPSVGNYAFSYVDSSCIVLLPHGNGTYAVVNNKWQGMEVNYYGPNFEVDASGIIWTYAITNGEATLGGGHWPNTAVPQTTSGVVNIPTSLGGYPVTSIGDGAFCRCYGITGVTIPDSVTSIGYWALAGCSFTEVYIPKSVTNIAYGAFSEDANIVSFFVDESNPAYKSQDGLLLSKDGTILVHGVNGDVIVLDTVTTIAEEAFYARIGLTSIDISKSVTRIGRSAFCYCYGLVEVTIPDSVTEIEDSAFASCESLASVTIPDSVTSIGNDAFGGCHGLTSVTIPDSVTRIGGRAFSSCRGLTSVTIPDSVTSIGGSAFDGTPFYNDLPDGLVLLGKVAYKMKGTCLASVEIPDGIVSIGERAFYYCSGLTSIAIPDSVTSIGNYAFLGCRGLTSVTIPDGVMSIGRLAFADCSGLTNVTMRGDAPNVGSQAFDYIGEGAVVHLPRGSSGYDVDADGKWQGMKAEYYDAPNTPMIDGDDGATVEGDAENGYTIKPSADKANVEVTIPDGVDPDKVTVEVAATVETVTANGAKVKVMKDDDDITEHLDLAAVTQDGLINLASAQVREEVAKEALDTEKGAKFDISDTESPELTTAETKPGLVYTLLEGATLEDMKNGDSKLGDGTKWTPTITVKGGTSGFYTIKVEK